MMTTKRRLHRMHQTFAVALVGSFAIGSATNRVIGAYPVPQGDPRCNKCADGNCVPNRFTYGYYAPKWRRWPGATTGPENIPAPPEKRPTPEEEEPTTRPPVVPETSVEPDASSEETTRPDSSKSSPIAEPSVPNTRTTPRGNNTKELPAPTVDEDLLNEILDGDSSNSSTTPAPGAETPSTDLPPFPGTETNPAVPDTETPGTNDTSDPFSDDPTQSSRGSHGGVKRAAVEAPATLGSIASRRKATKVRMRTVAIADSTVTHLEDSAVQAAVASEPATVVPTSSGNPLRQKQATDTHQGVVPTGAWSGGEEPAAVTRAVWRTNPLR